MSASRIIAAIVAALLFLLGCALSIVSARMSLDPIWNESRPHEDVRIARWVAVVAFGVALGFAFGDAQGAEVGR